MVSWWRWQNYCTKWQLGNDTCNSWWHIISAIILFLDTSNLASFDNSFFKQNFDLSWYILKIFLYDIHLHIVLSMASSQNRCTHAFLVIYLVATAIASCMEFLRKWPKFVQVEDWWQSVVKNVLKDVSNISLMIWSWRIDYILLKEPHKNHKSLLWTLENIKRFMFWRVVYTL